MSFDLFLECFKTGESMQVNRPAVLEVLRNSSRDSADSFGFYNVEFVDGSSVEFSAKGLEMVDKFTGCAFHIRSVSQAVISFVFDVAVAGNMIIFNAQGTDEISNPSAILVSESQISHLPEGSAVNPVVCGSARHLLTLLGLGFEQWEKYRDSATGRK